MQFGERLEPTLFSTFCIRSLLCRFTPIHASFVDFVCFGLIMTRQQKLSLFFTQKRMAVEENQEDALDKDGEAEEVSSMFSQPPELQEPRASNPPSNTVRKFRPAWKNVNLWLQYDQEKGMSCSFCVKHEKNNAFTKGTTNFRSSMLERHVTHHDQVDALRNFEIFNSA